jgi:predicted membrane protein
MNEHISHEPSILKTSSDRSFGFVFSTFFLVVTVVLFFRDENISLWTLGFSLVFGIIALTTPSILNPLNRIWTKFGFLLHSIISPITLGIFFFGIITPIGFLMRLFKKRPLNLRLQKNVTTYWIPRTPQTSIKPESFENQF